MNEVGRHAPVRGPVGASPWPVRLVAVVRGLWGTVLLTQPREVVSVAQPDLVRSRWAPGVVRVLGGRHVGQAVVTAARPSRELSVAGALVDGLHAMTALTYAASARSRRRAGLSSASMAVGLGVAGLVATRLGGSQIRRGASSPSASSGSATPRETQPPSTSAPTGSVPAARHPESTDDTEHHQRDPAGRTTVWSRPAAGEQIQDCLAEQHARATTKRTNDLLASQVETPAPPVRPVATLVLLLLGGWIFASTFLVLHPYTVTGQNSALRDLGFAIVVTLSALWLRHVGANRAVSAVAVLAGVLLFLSAFLLPHDNQAVAVVDAVNGAAVALAAILGTVRRGGE